MEAPKRMGLLAGLGIYVVTFLVWSAVSSGRNLHFWPLVLYFASGIFLSRVVLRRMLAHNPDNLALSGCAVMAVVPVGRLLVTLFWPAAYPIIFLFLGLGKLLS